MTAVLDRLVSDGRFALRGFRRTPGFFVTAVLILGLGIGMSVAMFTVFRTVLVRRLPVTDQDHVVVMWTYRNDPSADYAVGTKELSVVRKQSHTMRDIAAVAHWPATPYPFIDGNRSVTLNRGMVTGNFFDVLGVRPALGRLMKPSDDYPDGSLQRSNQAPSAMVLSYRAWKEQFGETPGLSDDGWSNRTCIPCSRSSASHRRDSTIRPTRIIGSRCGRDGSRVYRRSRSRGSNREQRSRARATNICRWSSVSHPTPTSRAPTRRRSPRPSSATYDR